jgi:hypothetical protein
MQTPFSDMLIPSYILGQAMYAMLSFITNLHIGWKASFDALCDCSAGFWSCSLDLQMTVNSYRAD